MKGDAEQSQEQGEKAHLGDGVGDDGEVLGLVVGDDHAGGEDTLRLVGQQIAPLEVDVVGDDEALGDRLVALVEHLEDLDGLGAGGGAHVEHAVVGEHVEEERRHHRDGLLAGDAARLVLELDELVDVLQDVGLPELPPRHLHLPGELCGVPGQRPRGLHCLAVDLDGALRKVGEEVALREDGEGESGVGGKGGGASLEEGRGVPDCWGNRWMDGEEVGRRPSIVRQW